jgi:radical SAM protein with 4Fe4S-binding SPASM domain
MSKGVKEKFSTLARAIRYMVVTRSIKPRWEIKYIYRDNKTKEGQIRKWGGRELYEKHLQYEVRKAGYFQKKQAKSDFPLIVMLEVSALCNINCICCPRNIMERKQGNMDFDTFKRVMDECTEHELCQVTMHYSGEPLLNKKLPDMIKYAKNKGVPIVRFNTNGMLLNKETTLKLLKSGLDKMTVAIEATKEIHEKLRDGSDYALVSENIRNFVKMRDAMGLEYPTVWVQMLTSKWTRPSDIEYGITMWEPIVNSVEVCPITTIGGQMEDMGCLYTSKPFCAELWANIAILWNGDVTVCCVDHNARLKVGNVLNESIQDIWNSEKYDMLRRAHKDRDYSRLPDRCKQCIAWR